MQPDRGAAFSEDDLAPSADDLRRRRTARLEKGAAICASLAAGVVVGGMVALGACAAPAVFRLVPLPLSGDAMGTAFARFDSIAIGGAAVILGAELLRTFLGRRARPTLLGRARRISGIVLAGLISLMALSLTPTINELHRAGVTRGQGEDGQRLDAVHRRAELIGKLEALLALALIGLHIGTLRSAAELADDEAEVEDAPAPLPPGPRD